MSEHGSPQSPSPSGPPFRPKWSGSCDSMPPSVYEVQRAERYIRDQFVVTGVQDEMDVVVNRVRGTYPGVREWPTDEIALKPLRDLLPNQPGDVPSVAPPFPPRYSPEQLNNLAIRVYHTPEDVDVDDVIATFYRREADQAPLRVYAEHNYLIGNPDLAGSSGCIEGGPAGAGQAGGGEAAFWDQWAFDAHGIDLHSRKRDSEGLGSRVAVFDTSPFNCPGLWQIDWITPNLDLCVSHPEPLALLRPKGHADDYRDHGLFVSSLVHAVAPKAQIHLIRVLNEYNLGDLGTLVRALCGFLLQAARAPGSIGLEDTVLNLSLGLKAEPGKQASPTRKVMGYMGDLERDLGTLQLLSLGDEVPVVCLEEVLRLARRAGVTIVAAAGNQSKRAEAKKMMIPAAYPSVIGVAGHNIGQGRSNFSNQGDIVAPAGDGPPDRDPIKSNVSRFNPNDWLVGLSVHSAPMDGYMYWMGTSFAAPLVAGEIALGLGKGHPPGKVHSDLKAAATDTVPAGDTDLGEGCSKLPLT